MRMRRRSSEKRGFVLVTMALVIVGVFACSGLAIDVGRMFIAKNEAQAFCDASAMAAAGALDGTTTGITRARALVTNSANRWNLGTASFTNAAVTFATTPAGPYLANPTSASGYMYARVTVTPSVDM